MIIPYQTNLRKSLVFSAQIMFILLFKIALMPFMQQRRVSLPKGNSFLIASNHRQMLDPFAICAAMPLGKLVRLAPFAFIVADRYYDSWIRPILYILGGYPARNTSGKHKVFGVAASIDFLRRGYSVMIFPEGKLIPAGRQGSAYPGVSKIHAGTPSTPMAICHIEYQSGLRPIHVTLQKLKKPPANADEIMNDIYKL
jgi:1-acyl-sn-glycerol-3-phosphate acyltransferase